MPFGFEDVMSPDPLLWPRQSHAGLQCLSASRTLCPRSRITRFIASISSLQCLSASRTLCPYGGVFVKLKGVPHAERSGPPVKPWISDERAAEYEPVPVQATGRDPGGFVASINPTCVPQVLLPTPSEHMPLLKVGEHHAAARPPTPGCAAPVQDVGGDGIIR